MAVTAIISLLRQHLRGCDNTGAVAAILARLRRNCRSCRRQYWRHSQTRYLIICLRKHQLYCIKRIGFSKTEDPGANSLHAFLSDPTLVMPFATSSLTRHSAVTHTTKLGISIFLQRPEQPGGRGRDTPPHARLPAHTLGHWNVLLLYISFQLYLCPAYRKLAFY